MVGHCQRRPDRRADRHAPHRALPPSPPRRGVRHTDAPLATHVVEEQLHEAGRAGAGAGRRGQRVVRAAQGAGRHPGRDVDRLLGERPLHGAWASRCRPTSARCSSRPAIRNVDDATGLFGLSQTRHRRHRQRGAVAVSRARADDAAALGARGAGAAAAGHSGRPGPARRRGVLADVPRDGRATTTRPS